MLGLLRKALRVGLVRKEVSPGVIMDLDPEDYLQREILVQGIYEGATLGLLDSLLSKSRGFLDIGAHMGLFTLRAARALADCGGRVYSVEPTPTHASMLLHNAELSGLTNIELICSALSDFQALAVMASPHESNTGGSRLKECNIADLRRIPIRVPVLRYGDIASAISDEALDVVKLDIEGHEFRVLRQLIKAAPRLPSNLIVEFIPSEHHYDHELAWLESVGYEILEVDGRPYLKERTPLENNLWFRHSSLNQ